MRDVDALEIDGRPNHQKIETHDSTLVQVCGRSSFASARLFNESGNNHVNSHDAREVLRKQVPHGLRRAIRFQQNRFVALLAKPLGPFVRDIVYLRPYVNGSRHRLDLGQNVSAVNTLFNVSSGQIEVGDNTIFGHNCMILTGRHEFEDGRRRRDGPDVPSSGFDIRIGRDCWIASGAVVLGGVTIGDSVIVAAGAVVAHDVPSGSMVGGVPARILGATP